MAPHWSEAMRPIGAPGTMDTLASKTKPNYVSSAGRLNSRLQDLALSGKACCACFPGTFATCMSISNQPHLPRFDHHTWDRSCMTILQGWQRLSVVQLHAEGPLESHVDCSSAEFVCTRRENGCQYDVKCCKFRHDF